MAKKKKTKVDAEASNGAEAATAPKLARRHRESGEVGERKRGRPSPDYENGYLNEAGEFIAGDPPKKRGRRRRRGRPAGRPVGRPAGKGLTEVEQIVRREVDERLKSAREAMLKAFNTAIAL